MTGLRIEINRLNLLLDGFPASVAEEALADLGKELSARLARARWAGIADAPLVIDEVLLPGAKASVDAAALRAVLAGRIVDEILRLASAGESEAS